MNKDTVVFIDRQIFLENFSSIKKYDQLANIAIVDRFSDIDPAKVREENVLLMFHSKLDEHGKYKISNRYNPKEFLIKCSKNPKIKRVFFSCCYSANLFESIKDTDLKNLEVVAMSGKQNVLNVDFVYYMLDEFLSLKDKSKYLKIFNEHLSTVYIGKSSMLIRVKFHPKYSKVAFDEKALKEWQTDSKMIPYESGKEARKQARIIYFGDESEKLAKEKRQELVTYKLKDLKLFQLRFMLENMYRFSDKEAKKNYDIKEERIDYILKNVLKQGLEGFDSGLQAKKIISLIYRLASRLDTENEELYKAKYSEITSSILEEDKKDENIILKRADFLKGEESKGAIELYENMKNLGNAYASIALGLIYQSNNDAKECLDNYIFAAKLGYVDAFKVMSKDFYEEKKNIEIDEKQAFSYCEQAAFFGDASSQILLADFYKRGFGCAQDLEKSAFWLYEASKTSEYNKVKEIELHLEDLDVPIASFYLGEIAINDYNNDYEVSFLDSAKKHFEKAKKQGCGLADEKLKWVDEQLTPDPELEKIDIFNNRINGCCIIQ